MLARYEPPGTSRGKGFRLLSRTMRNAVFLAFVTNFCTPSFAKDAPATDAERKAAMQIYHDCQMEKANLIDDGVSDALTVGNAVASACLPEMNQMADVLSQGENRRVRSMLVDRLASQAGQRASTIVMLERNRRQNAGRVSPTLHESSPPRQQSAYDPASSKEAAAREQLMTGAHLLDACEAVDDEWAKCSAFIRGVMTAYRAGVLRGGGKAPYCLPEQYFAFEWTGDVVDFLKSNPDFSPEPAQSAVLFALEAKYPCPS